MGWVRVCVCGGGGGVGVTLKMKVRVPENIFYMNIPHPTFPHPPFVQGNAYTIQCKCKHSTEKGFLCLFLGTVFRYAPATEA